jgi:acetylornithine/succinyldiaminopimelate/putrescine aminotransferase
MANTDVTKEALKQGVLVIGAGENVVRFLPPLTITAAELSDGLERFRKAACNLAAYKC